jgi:hypothetical protein
MTTVYHGTPFQFDTLREESWVATSLFQSVIHLFLRNVKEHRVGVYSGWVWEIPSFNLDLSNPNLFNLSDDVVITTTTSPIDRDQCVVKTFDEAFQLLDSPLQDFILKSRVTDLTELLKTN